jgi:crotonobetainyl-CoA:carnitine CoA-transferase CaiB-like acyl-CoA transferase
MPGLSGLSGPLTGVRVIEAGSYVSGPFAGQMLADLGAEVIKVENPLGGDAFRSFGRPSFPVSPVFANCNRGKRSVAPDLKDPADRDRLLRLVESSDVWMSNWRPGVADRLGLGDEVLAATNPHLIRAYITGYGSEGPRTTGPVFDLTVQAASGLMDAVARSGRPEVLPGYPVDKLTSMMAAQAVIAALFARERRNDGAVGERIDISMLSATAYVDYPELFANRTFLDGQAGEARNMHAVSLRALRASDGWIAVAPVSGHAIRSACEALGHPEWAEEVRAFADQSDMATALFERLDTVLPGETVAHWLELFAKWDVPAAECLSMDAHLEDAQARAQEIYSFTDWDGFGRVRVVRYPAEFGSVGKLALKDPPPEVGADDEELLGG